MARPQETFNKKEMEKKRLQKKKEKEQRKEERKANAKEGLTLEDMMAYVDENGNITSTPPDPNKKRSSIKVEDVVIGSRNNESATPVNQRTGTVTFFNTSKGFGFIRDNQSKESIFVGSKSITMRIQENDVVTFETEMGPKGLNAINVKLVR